MKKFFGVMVTEHINEWFCLLPNKVTTASFRTPKNKVTIISYRNFSTKNVRNIPLPYIPKPGKTTSISVFDHILYTAASFFLLPLMLLSDGIIFVVPSYMPCLTIPVLKLFRKEIYLVVLDLQYALYHTYLAKGDKTIYHYWNILDT